MDRTSKMDLHGARTASDIERKYNFGKTFAEVMGIATDAQSLAKKAVELDASLTSEEIFNRLTNNGEAQGIFRGDDGEIYINAYYIVSLASMFAKDIVMNGTFTCETEGYVAPDDRVIETIQAHLDGGITIPDALIPLYDFVGEDSPYPDGQITANDLEAAKQLQTGQVPMDAWPTARKTPITMTIDMKNPERAISFTATDMWGGEVVDGYLGINSTSARCPATEKKIDELEKRIRDIEHELHIGG